MYTLIKGPFSDTYNIQQTYHVEQTKNLKNLYFRNPVHGGSIFSNSLKTACARNFDVKELSEASGLGNLAGLALVYKIS